MPPHPTVRSMPRMEQTEAIRTCRERDLEGERGFRKSPGAVDLFLWCTIVLPPCRGSLPDLQETVSFTPPAVDKSDGDAERSGLLKNGWGAAVGTPLRSTFVAERSLSERKNPHNISPIRLHRQHPLPGSDRIPGRGRNHWSRRRSIRRSSPATRRGRNRPGGAD